MKSAFKSGIGHLSLLSSLLLGLFIAGQLVAQELPSLEPIPSPAADDSPAELPALEIPTPADPRETNEDLQPVPETTPLSLDTPSSSEATSDQVTYEQPIVEGPFSDVATDEGPALEPIADQSTYHDVATDTPSIDFQPQPVHLPNDSDQTASIAPVVVEQPVVNQPIIEQPVYSAPSYEQPSVTYQQPIVQPQQTYQPQVIICPKNQPQIRTQPAPQPEQRVVVQPAKPAPKVYYRVETRSVVTQPQPQIQVQRQPTVVIRQNVRPANEPRPQYTTKKYYAVPQPQVQQAQYEQPIQQVRVPRQAPPAARPVNFEVQVTETTQYRPVQVRVTESYQTAPRPTATIVVPAERYVPFQPFRNAVRRRW